jgi:S1-C subfamily serine protease
MVVTHIFRDHRYRAAGPLHGDIGLRAYRIASRIESGSSSGTIYFGDSPMLGVGVGPGLRAGGVPVRQVLDGSPADQVGLAPGDVITGFDGKTVNSDTTLTDLLDQHYPGNVVSVTWLDQVGQPHNATVPLGAAPSADSPPPAPLR